MENTERSGLSRVVKESVTLLKQVEESDVAVPAEYHDTEVEDAILSKWHGMNKEEIDRLSNSYKDGK